MVLLRANADGLDMQAVLRHEVAHFAERDDEEVAGPHGSMTSRPEIYKKPSYSSMVESPPSP
jgi:hypothetical protein